MPTTKAQIRLSMCSLINSFDVLCPDSIIPLVSISEISACVFNTWMETFWYDAAEHST